MFGNGKEKANYDRPTTVIGKETLIQSGKIESKQSVQINGKVVADFNIEASLVVGQTGFIEGNIESSFLLVAGRVEGNINVSQQVHLTKSAVVIGDIECQSIVIDDGAMVEGRFSMKETVLQQQPEEVFES